MAPSVEAPLVALLLLLGLARWVYQDAGARQAAGRTVVFRYGNLVIDTPTTWAAACLVFWILAFPLYLSCRRES